MKDRRQELAAVFAGGCAGAALRAEVAEALPVHGAEWPWGTFAVNVAGALILGVVMARLPKSHRRAALGAGFCGALTTFSTFQLELLDLLDAGRVALAAAYASASLAAGIAAVNLGGRA